MIGYVVITGKVENVTKLVYILTSIDIPVLDDFYDDNKIICTALSDNFC